MSKIPIPHTSSSSRRLYCLVVQFQFSHCAPSHPIPRPSPSPPRRKQNRTRVSSSAGRRHSRGTRPTLGTGRWTESGRRAAPTTRGIRSARQAGRCGAEAPPDRTLVLCITTVFGGSVGPRFRLQGGERSVSCFGSRRRASSYQDTSDISWPRDKRAGTGTCRLRGAQDANRLPL